MGRASEGVMFAAAQEPLGTDQRTVLDQVSDVSRSVDPEKMMWERVDIYIYIYNLESTDQQMLAIYIATIFTFLDIFWVELFHLTR